MRRIFTFAPAALSLAACAIPVLAATEVEAASPLLDPGWQLGVVAPSAYSSGGGVIEQMFSDSGGATVSYRAAPIPVPVPAPMPAPMYYRPAPQPRAYRSVALYYQVPAPQVRTYQPARGYYQPAPVYYRQALVPAPQPRAYQPATVYYQQAAMPAPPPPRAYQPAPVYYQQAATAVSPPQRRISQAAPMVPPQVRVAQAAPQYTGSVSPPPSAPQAAPAPHRSFFQLTQPQQQAAQPPSTPPLVVVQQPARSFFQLTPPPQQAYAEPSYAPSEYGDMAHPMLDPKYERQIVDYHGTETPGTVVVDTPHYFLYLVMEGGKAMRYGIGIGRQGFTWSGTNEISAKREWPDWRPPPEMLERRPDLPRYMAGGPDNPLGARALYVGSTLYRIHGSNEPWTIGTQVSSGCIRLRNADIVDLYERVNVGSKVVVL